MGILFSFFAGVALSMDCLAVASCYGIQSPKNRRLMLELGLWFGFFQFVMIIIGNMVGSLIITIIYKYAKILSVLILAGIAIKMFIEGIKGEEKCLEADKMRILYLAFATSVDSLLVGLAYSMLRQNLLLTAVIVGITCFVLTLIGFNIGSILHRFVGRVAQFLGSMILFLIAIKSLFVD
ncbi:MAG: manganese efflux pump MntP family protein [Deltaproteobacteria bacterium]|nr:manganese efflux pump MntP family protein [Deltaproteobacteria bacterium]